MLELQNPSEIGFAFHGVNKITSLKAEFMLWQA